MTLALLAYAALVVLQGQARTLEKNRRGKSHVEAAAAQRSSSEERKASRL